MTSKEFKVNYLNKDINKKTFNFRVSGDEKYGLDKSIANGIRRTLLSDIKTVAINPDNIIINTNSGSLHNEFLKHRISLTPLCIDPEHYNYSLLFELKVKIDENPTMNVYSEDFNIYPLKNEYIKLVEEGDIDTIDMLKNINKNYYNLNNPLSKNDKKKIFKPFKFGGKDNYMLITELKNTGSETNIQELDLYTVPTIGTTREHSRHNNIPTVVYTFTKDVKAFQKHLEDTIILEKVKENNKSAFKKSLELKESERYFHRDINNLPYMYDFTITSNHYYDSKTVYLKSLDILIGRFEYIGYQLEQIIEAPEESIFSYDTLKNNMTYQIVMLNQDDTAGNMIQSHMINKFIKDDSTIQVCGYKKLHPLTELIVFNIMIKPGNYTELQKKTYIIKTFTDVCKDLINILDIMKKELK
jgi:DNA-directed RNA polymerase subunit L